MDENRTVHEEPRNPHVRHEPGDINAPFLTKFGIGMSFLVVIFLFGLWGLFDYFLKREQSMTELTKKGLPALQKQPPEPRLQRLPARDMQQMLADENRAMQQYGWVDPDKGIIRIPVSRAMDIIAAKGLPANPQAPTGSAPAGKKQ